MIISMMCLSAGKTLFTSHIPYIMKSVRFFLFVFPVTVFATTLVEQHSLTEVPVSKAAAMRAETKVIQLTNQRDEKAPVDQSVLIASQN